MPAWTFHRNMPVYLRNGKLLGHTVEISHAADYLHVQQGRLLIADWYIPIETVKSADAGGVRLGANIAELRRGRYHIPADRYLLEQGATGGYEHAILWDMPSGADAGNRAAAPDSEETRHE